MVNSKLPDVGVTVFSRMSALAEHYQAINLSQGFPGFDGPTALREALGRHVMAGHNQYAPMAGLPALRQQVAKKIGDLYGADLDPDSEITITPGATEAIFCAVQAVVGRGDEVIVLDPCYDSYEPAVRLAGGHCVHVPLSLPDFTIDWQRLTEALSSRTRLIIINSPHNPSGALITRADLDRLAALLRERDVYLLADEVYEHLVFGDRSHDSVLAHPELYERAFVVSSFGKTYHMTGWKTGYVVAPPRLTAELRKIHQYVTFCGVMPVQCALAEFMAAHPEHVRELPGFYQHKRDLFCDLLAGSGFRVTPAAGTYFQVADYSAVRNDLDDLALCEWLVAEHGVAAIPVSMFYQTPPAGMRLVRFCFAKSDATLRDAAQRLAAVAARDSE